MKSTFKEVITKRKPAIGTLLTLNSTEVAEILSQQGFDWIFIDAEHGALSTHNLQQLTQIVQKHCLSIVRVPDNNPTWIKKILDTGCDGIIIPQVKTAIDAQNAIKAAKYPPQGQRSVGIARAQGYGLAFNEYVANANKDVAIIIQIEHIDVVENLDDILKVKGIDGVLIGPYDLSGSMNMLGEVSSKPVQDVINVIRAKCKEYLTPYGIFVMKPEAAKLEKTNGCSFIAIGIDTILIGEAAKNIVFISNNP